VICLEGKDRENVSLNNRLMAGKPAKLLSVSDVTQSAIEEAETLASGLPTSVGIIVNRVATAKAIYEQLRVKHREAVVELVIGSMRPFDRDQQAMRLRPLVGPDRPKITEKTNFIVATQCLEVGADYDFDALVTECASLDALRQRFGRLNRGGRKIEAHAVILIDNENVKDASQLDDKKPLDPIYGNSLTRTWHWLDNHAERVITEQGSIAVGNRRRRNAAPATIEVRRIDFGIDAFNAVIREHGDNGLIPTNLLAPSASLDAPVMLPAYLDVWCQTAPRPTPDPEVSLFIHGPQSGEPDVQVCWRADLIEDGYMKKEDWCDVVALLPPTAAECMSVPISRLRRWLTSETGASNQSDLLGVSEQPTLTGEGKKGGKPNRKTLMQSRLGVLWRGVRDSDLIRSPDDLRPGDTLVLPVGAEGWNELGHLPTDSSDLYDSQNGSSHFHAHPARIDVAEPAFRMARDRVVLRLHPAMRSQLPNLISITDLIERVTATDDPPTMAELRRLLRVAGDETKLEANELAETFYYLANPTLGLLREQYPDDRGVVLMTRCRVGSATAWFLPPVDDGEDDHSRTFREFPVGLADHTEHVCQEVSRILSVLPCTSLTEYFRLAADLHDLGKADERFQAMLRRTDRTDAWLLTGLISALLAKSDGLAQTRSERDAARIRAGLPAGFRHEMLSVQLSERHSRLPVALDNRDLVLHFIASHHGHARPFAPVVIDDDPPDVSVSGSEMTTLERQQLPPHRFDSGIAERFWNLTRRYGWWGLAYLESILRLADQQASADEDAGLFEADANSQLAEATR
jgi:CRISPR-associated endonuclease/helicase Cas3